jgi:hypothetical protein
MEYQYWVVQDWNHSIAKKCGMGLDEYYETVVKHLPSTETTGENAYEPVQLNLKVNKDTCIPLSVAVTDNWYQRLQQVVTDTYFRNKRIEPTDVRFVDVTRKDIRGLSGDQLASCGKIRAFDSKTNTWLQVSTENVEPPTELRTDKQTQLVEWFDRKCKERLVQATAKLLSNCTDHDIVLRTKVDGPLDIEFRKILRETVPGGVSNVMKTFGSTDKARAVSGETAIARASETILRQLRQGLRTNQAAVSRTIHARIAASVRTMDDRDVREEPIFDHIGNEADVHSAAQEQKLFSNITRKALGKGVINIINHFYRGIGCGVCKKPTSTTTTTMPKVQVMNDDDDAEDDPAYYSDYYYGAVNKRFQDKYHAVAGRAVFMEPAAASSSSFQGLRGARLRKKVEQQRVSSAAAASSIPPRPKTIPLPSAAPVASVARPKLVPLEPQRPKLIPLASVAEPVMVVPKPKLIPLESIGAPTQKEQEQEPRRIRPPLVKPPNKNSNNNLTQGVQRVNDGLPDFLDFLNKK